MTALLRIFGICAHRDGWPQINAAGVVTQRCTLCGRERKPSVDMPVNPRFATPRYQARVKEEM